MPKDEMLGDSSIAKEIFIKEMLSERHVEGYGRKLKDIVTKRIVARHNAAMKNGNCWYEALGDELLQMEMDNE